MAAAQAGLGQTGGGGLILGLRSSTSTHPIDNDRARSYCSFRIQVRLGCAAVTKPHPENLPGTKEQRVFIGGQYDFMPTLREIARFVFEISSPERVLIPIIPYDYINDEIPETKTMEWDLSILTNCRYANVDLSDLGAQ